ncbi:MAG: DNA polymerase III subunit beta [Gammaproteobacteria bacterium]|nr:DNA polymerase III subunit beta [Gammaproteobacteria bacterium]
MQLTIDRERLLKPLQLITNAVDKKQALPILSNILLKIENDQLILLGTDLEIQLVKSISLDQATAETKIAVPAKKLHDICRALPTASDIHFVEQETQLLVRSGKSRFTLSLMSADDFPTLECEASPKYRFVLPAVLFKNILSKTHFAMSQQDVRHFLNGLFLDFFGDTLHAVAMDGHRLALSTQRLDFVVNEHVSVLLPRRAVLELMKLLEHSDATLDICIGDNYVSVQSEDYCFSTKLIEGNFPEYRALIPKSDSHPVVIQKELLRDALSRVAVLSHDKSRGVWLTFDRHSLKLNTHNSDKDEAEEEIPIEYDQAPMRLGFNLTYLLDVLSVLEEEAIRLYLMETSVLIQSLSSDKDHYLVMTMWL